MKREDYLSWDEYFMGIAVLSSLRSKDPSTQVGACIVDKNHRILSVGYNGMPFCSHNDNDEEYFWGKSEGLKSKYLYVCHAELNAILNCHTGSVAGSIVYTTLFPCNECAKAIIQSGIKEVVYLSDKYADTDGVKASKRMFDLAEVKYRAFGADKKSIELKLN